ncbi:sensor domain-containing protein [Gynuella sunshinyii]|uniref:Putative signal transduction protein containing a membrane domain, an EAL and a GGDEF domain n=1 Tax=Gynuella sunshinyii YC6258 TaxID=1445510 RepID=A0A0C5VU61_9GAMM|nr:bifunctional diguanylate cyclase/phosphodiesterase [Gynuella sunshinyii]AJQ93929.1 putative signal transduction protein containing a membrane domain, an EAL and a GGDEF domain [Gynuella sunshinyii YC6258]
MNLSRRQDQQLRETIDRLHHCEGKKSTFALFNQVLKDLAVITGSRLSFVILITKSEKKETSLRIFSSYDTDRDVATQHDMVLEPNTRISTCLNAIGSSNIPQVFQRQSLSQIPYDRLGWRKLGNMIALPLIDSQQSIGILCLANSKNGYSIDMAKRFWPLLITTVSIFNSIQRKQQKTIHLPGKEEETGVALQKTQYDCPLATIEINKNHKITSFNPAAETLFGVTDQFAIDREITTFLPERFPNEHRIYTFSPHNQQVRCRAVNAVGMELMVDITVTPYIKYGQTHYLLFIQNNSELRTLRRQSDQETQRFEAVSDLAPIGILQTNRNWACTYVNRHWCDICGLTEEELNGHQWINLIHQDDLENTMTALRQAITEKKEFSIECRFNTPQGETIWVELNARAFFGLNRKPEGVIATITDNTYRHHTERKLRDMAELDSLTGLPNRALFQERLENALNQSLQEKGIILLCLDLDDFKNINDSFGHDVGDELLTEVARRLQKCLHADHTIARVGGDEFMILMEGIEHSCVASEVSEKIMSQLAQPCLIRGNELFISTSIGITFAFENFNTNSKTLIKQADIALYRAKSEGRNNYQFYSPELERASKDRTIIRNSLHNALDRGEMEVYYQLQADVNSGRYVGSEALLRWHHPTRGLISPTKFIAQLEETRLIIPISHWLLQQVVSAYLQWQADGLLDPAAHISINLSPRQLYDQHLVKSFEQVLNESGLPGEALVVEITESILLEESPSTLKLLSDLKDLGIQIALDDFGTGYSSLTYLKRYPIDYIKVDRSFMRDILFNQDDESIVRAVIALAHSLKLKVIAEGVDNHEKVVRLQELGCDYFQGYLLNKPMNMAQTANLLFKHKQQHVINLNHRHS